MKFLIVLAFVAVLAAIVADAKDPGQVASDCKAKFSITDAEEEDIRSKKFQSKGANPKVCKFFPKIIIC